MLLQLYSNNIVHDFVFLLLLVAPLFTRNFVRSQADGPNYYYDSGEAEGAPGLGIGDSIAGYNTPQAASRPFSYYGDDHDDASQQQQKSFADRFPLTNSGPLVPPFAHFSEADSQRDYYNPQRAIPQQFVPRDDGRLLQSAPQQSHRFIQPPSFYQLPPYQAPVQQQRQAPQQPQRFRHHPQNIRPAPVASYPTRPRYTPSEESSSAQPVTTTISTKRQEQQKAYGIQQQEQPAMAFSEVIDSRSTQNNHLQVHHTGGVPPNMMWPRIAAPGPSSAVKIIDGEIIHNYNSTTKTHPYSTAENSKNTEQINNSAEQEWLTALLRSMENKKSVPTDHTATANKPSSDGHGTFHFGTSDQGNTVQLFSRPSSTTVPTTIPTLSATSTIRRAQSVHFQPFSNPPHSNQEYTPNESNTESRPRVVGKGSVRNGPLVIKKTVATNFDAHEPELISEEETDQDYSKEESREDNREHKADSSNTQQPLNKVVTKQDGNVQIANSANHSNPTAGQLREKKIETGNVVVSNSMVNQNEGATSQPTAKQLQPETKVSNKQRPRIIFSASTPTTESLLVVASVQTSRSVSNARFLPPSVASSNGDKVNASEVTLNRNSKNSNNSSVRIVGSQEVTSIQHTSTIASTENKDERSELSDNSPPPAGYRAGKAKKLKQEEHSQDQKGDNNSNTGNSAAVQWATTTIKVTSSLAPEQTNDEEKDEEESEADEPLIVRKFTPSSRKGQTTTNTESSKPKNGKKTSLFDSIQFDELTNLLPEGFKVRGFTPTKGKLSQQPGVKNTTSFSSTTAKTSTEAVIKDKDSGSSLLSKFKIQFDDVRLFLPPDYKPPPENESESSISKQKTENPTAKSAKVDSTKDARNSSFSAGRKAASTTSSSIVLSKAKPVDISAFLPPGYQLPSSEDSSSAPVIMQEESRPVKIDQQKSNNEAVSAENNNGKGGENNPSKVVFPSRAGKKPQAQTKSPSLAKPTIPPHQVPLIQKGWPIRATTEFHGWSTPSPSPISIEKLLQSIKGSSSGNAAGSGSTTSTTTTSTTTTTTTTTTTEKPTTPGICSEDCELAGSIRLVSGTTWVPELSDHNTREWRTLASDVQSQLEAVFQSSEVLSKWYKKISVDGFNPGSVIVDYFVELSDLGRTVSTADMKRLFKDTLVQEAIIAAGRSGSDDISGGFANGKQQQRSSAPLKFGKFAIDPSYIDFVVLPRSMPPTMSVQQDMWLPQWAMAVIVIGLASLLFVFIFAITVFVNRRRNALKHPSIALTDDMLHELSKDHMGGNGNLGIALDSSYYYGGGTKDEVEDLYNMDDVWNEKPVSPSLPKKKSTSSNSNHYYHHQPYQYRDEVTSIDSVSSRLNHRQNARHHNGIYDSWRSGYYPSSRNYGVHEEQLSNYYYNSAQRRPPSSRRPSSDYDLNF